MKIVAKILEISLARSFKNLAIEPCKILAKKRQDFDSKYMQVPIVMVMQDHVKIVVRSWKFCYRTMQDLIQDKARSWSKYTGDLIVTIM